MKEFYVVANNAFTVTVDGELTSWKFLRRRFSPFAVSAEECADRVLDIEIRSGQMPQYAGEKIYEPAYTGIGFISACASSLSDGSIVMEFKYGTEEKDCLSMTMAPEMNRAEIVVPVEEDENTPYFLTHALMIAYMMATCKNGTLLIHSSSVLYDGKAYLFQGKSGTGKSTHADLWVRNIEGAELLNDDNPVIRFSADGTAMAYGSPWSGKTHCYRNVSAPIGAIVRIVRDGENRLHRLAPLKAFASLTPSVFSLPFLSERLHEVRHRTIERLAMSVPCCEMYCRPDADAALTCLRGLEAMS